MPFWLTTLMILGMILLYTYEGGVKTIVWTDTLQTTGMVLGLVICVGWLLHDRRSRGVPLILETPQENYDVGEEDDTPDPYDLRMAALLKELAG